MRAHYVKLYRAALAADEAWGDACRAVGVSRWSREAEGAPGSRLRALYRAKLNADALLFARRLAYVPAE